MCPRNSRHVPREFYDRGLHSETYSEIRHVVFAGISRRLDFAFHAAVPESARHYYSVRAAEQSVGALRSDLLGFYPVNVHLRAAGESSVTECLRHRHISVEHSDVLADQRNFHGLFRTAYTLEHIAPVAHIRTSRHKPQFTAYHLRKIAALQHYRRVVYGGHGKVLYNAIGLDVAEQREFCAFAVPERQFLPSDDYVGAYTRFHKFFHRMLRRLGFLLARARDVRHQSHVNEQTIVSADLARNLPYRLEKRLTLDVTRRTAYLGQHNVGARFAPHLEHVIFDFARDMRYCLHGFAQILARPLLVENVPVNLARSEIGVAVEVLVYESLVMS